MADNINHPEHYTSGDIECIDAIKSAIGGDLFLGYLWGNAIKYLWRWPNKGLAEDLWKCEWYINRIFNEGYTVPVSFDDESDCYVPNTALGLVNDGVYVQCDLANEELKERNA